MTVAGGGEADAAGLVSCAIVATSVPDTPELLFGTIFRFPSAEMIRTAAAMFPTAPTAYDSKSWHVAGFDTKGVSSHQSLYAANSWAEFSTPADGVWPQLTIGPGMVKFSRKDEKRADAARARAEDSENAARRAAVNDVLRDTYGPMAFASTPTGPSRIVTQWSRKSMSALRRQIASLDLSPLVMGVTIPAMITLTLPGDWLAVAPDASTLARKFHRWTSAYTSKWGPMRTIWKREFQKRGAPHYHLWIVPPVPASRMGEFTSWLSESWTRVLFNGVEWSYGPDHDATLDRCSCCEYCRSLAAGTGLDFVAGLRARDPNRLAEYFLKEAGHSEAKAYQNVAPAEWAGQSIGRFWGVRGIDKAVVTIDLHPADQYKLWRVLRKVRRARGPKTRQWTVDRGVNMTTGEVRRRRVTRRTVVGGVAGWVAVNDGASFGAQLAKYASELDRQRTLTELEDPAA